MEKSDYIVAAARAIRSAQVEPAIICTDASAREIEAELLHQGQNEGTTIASFTELGISRGRVYRLADRDIATMFGSPHYFRVGPASDVEQEWRRLSGFLRVD